MNVKKKKETDFAKISIYFVISFHELLGILSYYSKSIEINKTNMFPALTNVL